jgi:hypothetical protein
MRHMMKMRNKKDYCLGQYVLRLKRNKLKMDHFENKYKIYTFNLQYLYGHYTIPTGV